MSEDVIKNIQILLVLSPLFLSIIAAGIILNYGLKKLEKYELYWLVGFILLSLALAYGLLRNNISALSALGTMGASSEAWGIYLRLKKKNKK